MVCGREGGVGVVFGREGGVGVVFGREGGGEVFNTITNIYLHHHVTYKAYT